MLSVRRSAVAVAWIGALCLPLGLAYAEKAGPGRNTSTRAIPGAGAGAGADAEAVVASVAGGDSASGQGPDDSESRKKDGSSGDVLAATESWTFVVGSGTAAYDSVRKKPQASGSASSHYRRSMDTTTYGYTTEAGLALAAGAYDRDGSSSDTGSFGLVFHGAGRIDGRLYPGLARGAFGYLETFVDAGASMFFIERRSDDYSDIAPSYGLGAGIGLGYGRILDVGAALRLRRLESILRQENLLARPIDADTARELFAIWWGLRGETGSRRRLVATLKVLRESGTLLVDPDPETTYSIVQVLEDQNLDGRFAGVEARCGIGEAFEGIDARPQADDLEWSRAESLIARALYGRQLAGGTADVTAAVRASYKLGDPGLWTVQGDVALRRFFYGREHDPVGALELSLSAGISDAAETPPPERDAGHRISGSVGYTAFPNRASSLRVAATITAEADDFVVGLAVTGFYGLLPSALSTYSSTSLRR
ncbi:MAG: hypothetical protein V2A73_09710 [Pseudomonadota bacterium]